MGKIYFNPDAIKVAPLHHPKPKADLRDLKHEKEDSELFDGEKPEAPVGAKLVYKKGRLIENVEVYTIFWGKNWTFSKDDAALAKKLNKYFKTILASPLMDQLAEYNTESHKIGHGRFTGTISLDKDVPVSKITDTEIKAALTGWIDKKIVPEPNLNTLYFIYLDGKVKVHMGGSQSCSGFCGYHNDIKNNILYAVMPFPDCAGCLGGMDVFSALTGTSSHELCEAITDPIAGSGWYDNTNGEIGDICAWNFKKVDGYQVQKEWSNKKNKCI